MWLQIITNVTLGLTFLASLAYLYLKNSYNYWKKRNVVSPPNSLLYGSIKETALRHTDLGCFYQEVYESFPNEKVVGIYRMWTPCLVVRDLDILQHVLIKDFDKFVDRGVEFSKDGLGMNIFNADADSWRVLRSRISPIFTSGKLKGMMPLMNQQAAKFREYVDQAAAGGGEAGVELDVWRLVQKFTIATISSTAFGHDVNMADLDLPGNVLSRINERIFTLSYFTEVDMAFPGLLKKLNLSILPSFVTDYFYGVVETVFRDRGGAPSGRRDFMDLMLELHNSGEIHSTKLHEQDNKRSVEITRSVIAAQAFVFYAAGFETSANTVSSLLRQLAMHPDVQERLYREIEEVEQQTGGDFTFEALKGMTYLGQVLDETLRMFPLVDPLQRRLGTERYRVPGTDLTIDKGTILLVPVRGIHMDERLYPDPTRFDPERFTPEAVKERHPCAYLPFGVGPRNCIGKRFAEVQSRLAIVTLLRRYRLEPGPRTPAHIQFDPYRVVTTPKGGNYLRVVPRNNN